MEVLTYSEIENVNGGFFFAPFLWGSLFGLGGYAFNKITHKELMSYEGAAAAAGIGGLTGGVGSMAAGAAGGGIIGNLAWKPGFMAINASGQAIVAENF